MTHAELQARLQEGFLVLDGGTGSLLQARGLPAGMPPDYWNLENPEAIIALHLEYYRAGSDVVSANTFGSNGLKLKDAPYSQEEIIRGALYCAKTARERFYAEQAAAGSPHTPKYISMDLGPLGKLLQPLGTLPFAEAVRLFGDMAALGEKYGADLILIETVSDSYEAKAAVLGAKERTNLPVLASVTFDATCRLMTGGTPESVTALMEGLGVTAFGLNCGLGPVEMSQAVLRLLEHASKPVIVKPNAGMPRLQDGVTYYDVSPSEFAAGMKSLVEAGARIVGGCCGTTPEHIRALREMLDSCTPSPLTDKGETVIASYTHALRFGQGPVLIGERINPTGKPRLKRALKEGDWQYVQNEGVNQQDAGAHALDVNMGLPGIREAEAMGLAVPALQSVTDLPLQIDTADPAALEAGMRCYNGKALINSVTGKQESMDAVFPLAAKYGGVIICLTLDENGIPATAEGRLAIAQKICAEAAKYGIAKKDLMVDPLAMAVSADPTAANTVLGAIRLLKEAGFCCSLGVSNISFGLPAREAVNAAFFAMALQAGLDAAILNVHSAPMMQTYHSFLTLSGQDPSCAGYIAYMNEHPLQTAAAPAAAKPAEQGSEDALTHALLHGMGAQACDLLKAELKGGEDPLALIDRRIVPALNAAGTAFEQGKLFLPQLLLCAEAATQGLELLKERILASGRKAESKGTLLLATVHGDIHDIGKNIVKTLLQSYGFTVVDLGKDVPPERILQEVQERGIQLVGLSALMTTTLPAMEQTIALLREHTPCKVVVGGAVLTPEYAASIGADAYGQTAMDTVRYAERVFGAKVE